MNASDYQKCPLRTRSRSVYPCFTNTFVHLFLSLNYATPQSSVTCPVQTEFHSSPPNKMRSLLNPQSQASPQIITITCGQVITSYPVDAVPLIYPAWLKLLCIECCFFLESFFDPDFYYQLKSCCLSHLTICFEEPYLLIQIALVSLEAMWYSVQQPKLLAILHQQMESFLTSAIPSNVTM